MSSYTVLNRKVRASGAAGVLGMFALLAWSFRAWVQGGNVQVTIGPLIGGVFIFCVMFGASYWASEE